MQFFSIIICTYNRAHLLPRALDSLLAQTEEDWEAIIVDDASADNTHAVVQNYVQGRANIRYLKTQGEKNLGVAAARNAGIKNSKGAWVTFLDSDDAYEADHLATRKRLLMNNINVQMLIGGCRVVGNPWVIDMRDRKRYVHVDECVIGGTFFIRRDVFDVIGMFPEGLYADDTLFYEKASAFGIAIARTDVKSYVYYREGEESETSVEERKRGREEDDQQQYQER